MKHLTEKTIPAELFSFSTSDDITRQYKKLALKYHPDKGGTAEEFQLLKILYEKALSIIKENKPWDSGKIVTWNNGLYKFEYNWKSKFELGHHYCGNNNGLFIIDDDFIDLNESSIKIINQCHNKLKNTSGTIQKTQGMIPNLKSQSGNNTFLFEKKPAFRPIKEVINQYGNFEPPFAAWIIGRLMHLLCFFEWMQLVHGGINLDNIYIDVDDHVIALYGGWWYTTTVGTKYKALPKSSIIFTNSKVSSYELDRECVRQTCLELLGANSAPALRMNKQIPKEVIDFLSVPLTSTHYAVTLYKQWESARDSGFGKRKFIKFKR